MFRPNNFAERHGLAEASASMCSEEDAKAEDVHTVCLTARPQRENLLAMPALFGKGVFLLCGRPSPIEVVPL